MCVKDTARTLFMNFGTYVREFRNQSLELDLLVKMYKLTTEHAVSPLRVGPALMRVRARRAPQRRRACIRSRQAACRW